ncbi:MAG TPA: c-type cytochrome [Gemmataceae bacterium]|nr:c-type cytochrome [Gemmataceae bacterium]
MRHVAAVRIRITGILIALAVVVVWLVMPPATSPTEVAAAEIAGKKVSFSKDIQPLLTEKCGNCHGAKKPKKGIDYVTSYETTMKTVRAGKPDESRLYKSLAGKGGKPMPPKKPLSEDEIAKVKAWIAAGAKNN